MRAATDASELCVFVPISRSDTCWRRPSPRLPVTTIIASSLGAAGVVKNKTLAMIELLDGVLRVKTTSQQP